jgi:hypothetical protein
MINISELIKCLEGMHHFSYEHVETNGCSASNFFTVHSLNTGDRAYFAKLSDSSSDWLSLRSHDLGREGRLLSSPLAERLWKHLYNPYIKVMTEGNDYGLLMEDISSLLLGNLGARQIEDYDDFLLAALAKIHAEFWHDSLELEAEYLMRPDSYLSIIGPYSLLKDYSQPIARAVMSGWEKARQILPPEIAAWISRPAGEIASQWAHLPRTLVHGDFRPANIGCTGTSAVLIDWAFCGYGPCTIDLYWFLATTSCWRVSIEASIRKYRKFLESELGFVFDEKTWDELCQFGVVVACNMQLWEKALDFSEQGATSQKDWNLWTQLLMNIVNSRPTLGGRRSR